VEGLHLEEDYMEAISMSIRSASSQAVLYLTSK
jgi:hypothetical protein